MVVKASHLNEGGVLHDGMKMVLAETICRRAVEDAAQKSTVSCASLNCEFFGTAQENDEVTVTATISRKSRAVVFVSADVKSENNAVLTASGLYVLD